MHLSTPVLLFSTRYAVKCITIFFLIVIGSYAHSADFYVGAGIQSYSVETEVNLGIFEPEKTGSSMHLGFGFKNRYGLNDQHAFGMGVDYASIDSADFFGFRALDYHRRIGNMLSVGGFWGAASWNKVTPQRGYYYGLNLQLEDVFKNVNVVAEYRIGNGMARDRYTALGDPAQVGKRPDIFSDISTAVIYVNWRLGK